MISAHEVIEVGKAFSQVIKNKYFPHVDTNKWIEEATPDKTTHFTFGETEPFGSEVVMVTDVLMFGTRPIRPRFSMNLQKDWEQDIIRFSFGLAAWETDRDFCKDVFQEFLQFVEQQGKDWFVGTFPVNEELVKESPIELMPTGENTRRMIQVLKNDPTVESSCGMFKLQNTRHLIHDTSKGQLTYYLRNAQDEVEQKFITL